MGRTRLRGIELAGVKLAIEVPSEHPWEWPRRELAQRSCDPSGADVYVGVRVAEILAPDWDPISYAFEGGSFDVGRDGEEWVVLVRDHADRPLRLARFDASFREGDVIVAPRPDMTPIYPLEAPLLDVVLQQRIVREGGLLVAGCAVARAGRALAIIGSEPAAHYATFEAGEWRGMSGPAPEPCGRLVMRPDADGVWVHAIPGSCGGDFVGPRARLDAIHIVSQSRVVYADRPSSDSARVALLEHVYAPVHDSDNADRLMGIADELVSRVSVLELGFPVEKRAIPFVWGGRQAAMAFAPPSTV